MKQQGMIKHFTYYFRPMMKFHDLKVQGVPQVLFVLLLTVSFGFRLLARPWVIDMSIYYQQFVNANSGLFSDPTQIDNLMRFAFSEEYTKLIEIMLKVMGLLALQKLLSMLLSFFYMGAYLSDNEGKGSATDYFRRFFRALPRFIGFQILFYIGIGILFSVYIFSASILFMILPIMYFLMILLPLGWLIIQVIFVFKEVTLLDTGVGILKNFALSWKLSAGNRLMIGRNIFFIVFLNMFIGMFTVGLNVILSFFIISFLEVIVLLIRQRLTVLMYLTRTRKGKEKIDED